MFLAVSIYGHITLYKMAITERGHPNMSAKIIITNHCNIHLLEDKGYVKLNFHFILSWGK